jgi:prevent-host-death family protein
MKIENIREVKTRFSRYVKDLPKSGSVLITKNGRPCAALVPVTEDTDLEALALSQNKRFWKLIDNAIARGKKRASSIWRTSEADPRYCHQLSFPI